MIEECGVAVAGHSSSRCTIATDSKGISNTLGILTRFRRNAYRVTSKGAAGKLHGMIDTVWL